MIDDSLNLQNFGSFWQDRVDLFRDIESAIGQNPGSETGQELAARWLAHVDALSDNDPKVKAGFLNAWADRRNWAATLRWREEGLSMMAGDRFDRVAEFLDAAGAYAI